jgi:hypothetical protein
VKRGSIHSVVRSVAISTHEWFSGHVKLFSKHKMTTEENTMGHNGQVWEEVRLVRNCLKTEHGGLKEKPITVVGGEDEDHTMLSG